MYGFVELIDSYLKKRKQFTKLGTKFSSERALNKVSVVQGSCLGPLLFILFINDIFKISIKGEMFLFADDMTLIIRDKSIQNLNEKVNHSLLLLSEYFKENRLILNVEKSFSLIFGTKNECFSPLYLNECIQMTNEIKILGVIIDKKLSFESHLNMVSKKLSKICSIAKRLRHFLPISALKTIYNSLFMPHLTYGCSMWSFTYDKHLNRVFKLQKRMARVVLSADPRSESKPLFKRLEWLTFRDITEVEILKFIFKNTRGLGCNMKFFVSEPQRRTRSANNKSLKTIEGQHRYTQNSIFIME